MNINDIVYAVNEINDAVVMGKVIEIKTMGLTADTYVKLELIYDSEDFNARQYVYFPDWYPIEDVYSCKKYAEDSIKERHDKIIQGYMSRIPDLPSLIGFCLDYAKELEDYDTCEVITKKAEEFGIILL